jgi:sporulation protein YabP
MATVYEEKNRKQAGPHSLSLAERRRLTLSGVEDVESFDEASITLYTSAGLLMVRGSGLKIEKLSIEGGELSVDGRIDSLEYADAPAERRGFWYACFRLMEISLGFRGCRLWLPSAAAPP